MRIDQLIELGEHGDRIYYVAVEVPANTEKVCDGMAIDDGGNTPHFEASRIVGAICGAIDDALGNGSTVTESNFHKCNRSIETHYAYVELLRDEHGDVIDMGSKKWIFDHQNVPPELQIRVVGAVDSGIKAGEKEAGQIEQEHRAQARLALAEAIELEDPQLARGVADAGLLSDEELTAASHLLAEDDD